MVDGATDMQMVNEIRRVLFQPTVMSTVILVVSSYLSFVRQSFNTACNENVVRHVDRDDPLLLCGRVVI